MSLCRPPHRRSFFVYEALIFVVSVVVMLQYGWLAWLGVIVAELLAYAQGMDRGMDLGLNSRRVPS